MTPVRNQKYFFDVVFFQVEDEIYKLPKKPFTDNPHPPFSDLFSLPSPQKDGAECPLKSEGTSEDNPIALEQILKSDFESFLSVLLVNPP
ncbi:hypothetical protein V5O48_018639, partial [Marasmius crinis-equi]